MSDEFCRICRGEETPEEPLFHPCKCSGSIKFVHEECLLGWVDHTNRKTMCDVCGTEYSINKVYDREMPSKLPFQDYLAYYAHVAWKKSIYLLYFGQFSVVWSFIAISIYSLILVAQSVVDSMISEGALILRPEMVFMPVKHICELALTSNHAPSSILPYVDNVLDIVTRKHFFRTALVDGSFFMLLVGLFGMFAYCLSMWVAMERAVVHDVEHITNGQVSHMDRGDADDFLESLTTNDGEFDNMLDQMREENELNARANALRANIAQAANAQAADNAQAANDNAQPANDLDADLLGANAPNQRRAPLQPGDMEFIWENEDAIVDDLRNLEEERRGLANANANENANANAEQQNPNGGEEVPNFTREDLRKLVRMTNANFISSEETDRLVDQFVAEHGLPRGDSEGAASAMIKLIAMSSGLYGDTQVNNSHSSDMNGPSGPGNASEQAPEQAPEQDSGEGEVVKEEIEEEYITESDSETEEEPEKDVYADWRRPEEVAAAEREPDEPEEDERFLPMIGGLFLEVAQMDFVVLLHLGLLIFVAFSMIVFAFFAFYYCYLYWANVTRNFVDLLIDFVPQDSRALLLETMDTLQRKNTPRSVFSYVVCAVSVDVYVIGTCRLFTLSLMRILLGSYEGRQFVKVSYILYVVHKTLLMTMIESLFFPTFCGSLIHLVTLPLTDNWKWHFEMTAQNPYAALALHWFVGYIYMHFMQLFVASCRRMFRPGVLYFLHKNDTTFFMRSMMLVALPRQLKRIAISAAIYGSFIIFGVGSAVGLLLILEPQTWPLDVSSPVSAQLVARLWPFAVCATSMYAILENSSKGSLRKILVLWVKERVWIHMFDYAAVKLDLGSWLFGRHRGLSSEEKKKLRKRDPSLGNFVRAPSDVPPLAVRTGGTTFVAVDQHDNRLDGKTGVQKGEIQDYTIVWRPKNFRWRILALTGIIWGSITTFTLLLTFVPLQLGKLIDWMAYNYEIKNDIVRTAIGLSVLLPVYVVLLKNNPPIELQRCLRFFTYDGKFPLPGWSNFVRALIAVSFLIISTPILFGPQIHDLLYIFDLASPLTLHQQQFVILSNHVLLTVAAAAVDRWYSRNLMLYTPLASIIQNTSLLLEVRLALLAIAFPTLYYNESKFSFKASPELESKVREYRYVLRWRVGNYDETPATSTESS